MPATRPVAVRLEDELVEKLEAAARAKKRNLSDEIRERLTASLEPSSPTPLGALGNTEFEALSNQIHASHLALARGFEGVFRALADPDGLDLDEALEFVRTKLRQRL